MFIYPFEEGSKLDFLIKIDSITLLIKTKFIEKTIYCVDRIRFEKLLDQ